MPEQPTPEPGTTPLEPELQRAERVLRRSIEQVCATDPTRVDTAEMIRLDEMLAIAGDAAKRAVSIRRRLRQEGRPTRARGAAEAGAAGAEPKPRARPSRRGTLRASEQQALEHAAGEVHRTFRDAQGITWSVWAVHPLNQGRAGLRGTFAQGWLAFVCENEKRRLSPVPDEWTSLDDAGLERLCCQAEVARQEAPTRRGPKVPPGEDAPTA